MSKKSISNHTAELKTVRVSLEARKALSREEIKAAIQKFASCNWGEVGSDEWNGNDEAFKTGSTIVARYKNAKGEPFLMITEAGKQGAVIKMPGSASLKRAC